MEEILAPGGSDFDRLVSLVRTLRGDRGCPWDRAQTPQTIQMYLVEEAYEVLEAIESGTHKEVCEELGDLLFHILFLARIFEESGAFDAKEVVRGITEKMIRRHPHVFGNVQVSCAKEVRERWHEMKVTEARGKDGARRHFLDSVPRKLPALMRAYRLGQRASMAGMSQEDLHSSLKKVEDSLKDLKAAFGKDDENRLMETFGDLLFRLTNVGRLMGVHPERALVRAISRFLTHFEAVNGLVPK